MPEPVEPEALELRLLQIAPAPVANSKPPTGDDLLAELDRVGSSKRGLPVPGWSTVDGYLDLPFEYFVRSVSTHAFASDQFELLPSAAQTLRLFVSLPVATAFVSEVLPTCSPHGASEPWSHPQPRAFGSLNHP